MTQRRKIIRSSFSVAAMACLPDLSFAEPKIRVAAIFSVSVEQAWISCVHSALIAASNRGDIDYIFIDKIAVADYDRTVSEFAQKGYRLIVGECFASEVSTRKIAATLPKTEFLMASAAKPQGPNFSVFDCAIHEPTYLAGMLAGGVSKSNKLGLIANQWAPSHGRLIRAFIAGARETNPNIEWLVSPLVSSNHNESNSAQEKEAAFNFIDRGADVLYAASPAVIDAAKEREKLVLGSLINWQAQYPDTVVASALWNMGPTIDRALKLIAEGKFKSQDYGIYSYMKVKGSFLTSIGTFSAKVPAKLWALTRQREAEIMAGKFTVRINDAELKSSTP